MADAPVQTPITLKTLEEELERRVVAAVLVKDRKSTRKQIRKYFAESKDLGFLSKEPEAPAPDGPALGKIINLAQNKHLIVTAMTNVMKENVPNATNPAHTSSTPSGPPPPAAGLYPVLLNPPHYGDTCCSSKPPLQATVFHITSGLVNLEGDTMDAAEKAHR